MTKPVIVAEAALRELERGARWYDQQREGLGDELLDNVNAIFEQLPSGTLYTRPVPGMPNPHVRRVLVERYPYAVIFAETDVAIHVVAIAHLKRRPRYWQGRLRRVLGSKP